MIFYKCPKCGNQMNTISTASIPPLTYYMCLLCGYRSKTQKEASEVIDLPKELWEDEDESSDNK